MSKKNTKFAAAYGKNSTGEQYARFSKIIRHVHKNKGLLCA